MTKLSKPAIITPVDFEIQVKELLERFDRKPKKFDVVHNTLEKAYDGEYQVDIKVTYEMLGAEFIVLIECKRHASSIKRETVQILNDRVRSLGAHKGILVSASNFQQGAIDYAKSHGIALARVVEGELTYQVKSKEKKFDLPDGLPEYTFIWIEKSEAGAMHTDLNSDYITDFEKEILNFKNEA